MISGTGASRTVTVTPASNLSGGPVTITLEVSDGADTNTASFTVTVNAINDPPTITGPSPSTQTINEGGSTGALTFTVGDIDNAVNTLTVTATSSDETLIPLTGILISGTGASRTVTVTPASNLSGGPVTITLEVSDGADSNTASFTVTVNAINDPPTITGPSPSTQTINEGGSTGALTFTVGDIDNAVNTLTVTATSSDETLIPLTGILISGTGASRTVTVTPASNLSGGPVTITLEVSDGADSNTASFTVTVNAINDPPTITGPSPSTQTINEGGSTGALTFTVGDIDNAVNTLTVTATSSDETLIPLTGILISGTGASRTVTVTPASNLSGGPVTITLEVSDGADSNTASFTVTVNAVNDPPTITGPSPSTQTINEGGSTGALTFTVGDIDNAVNTLTVTATSSDETLIPLTGILISGTGASRTVTVTPASNLSGGPVTITLEVSDGADSNTASFTVTVNAVNDPPTITPIANQSTNEDVATLPLAFTIGDEETAVGDLTLTATSGNQGVVPDANIVIVRSGASNTVQITPAANQSGTASITLKVNDGTTEISTSFQLTVNTVNDMPTVTTISDQAINEDAQTTVLPFTIDDVETAASGLVVSRGSSNLTLVPVANIVLDGTGASRTVQVTPVANQFGSATITISVSDGPNTASTTFQVIVNSVNDLPTISTIAAQAIDEDNATTALDFTVGDTETPVNTLTVSGTSDNTALVPNGNITFTGTGAARKVTVTPAANRFGIANITLTLNDGSNDVTTSFQVTVNPINDAPVITGQSAVSTNEEQPLEILFTHLTVTDADPDDLYPTDFSLTVLSNPNYTFADNTITPNANVTGTVVVRVHVNDGTVNSNIFNLQVTVNAVNDVPVITAQSPLSINEEASLTVLLSHLTIADPDNASGFTLSVATGSNYSVAGNTVTPNVNYNGTLSVPVTVSDGTNSSAPFNLQIQVNPVNDAPQITGQVSISIAEVQPVAIALSQLIVFDPDNLYPDDFTLDILSGANYSITENTVIPVANFSGTLLVRVFINDGVANSSIYNLQILVNSTNDPPVITGQQALTVNEGQSITIDFDDLVVTDPDNPYPTGFSLTILPGTNYTFSGSTITPNPNFDGQLTVGVKVNDGAVDSAPFNLQIAVAGINNAPTITGQYSVTTSEDVPVTLRLADLQVNDPDNSFPTGFTMTISNGTNYTVSGDIITPAANFNGTLSVPVIVNDGQTNSPSYDIQIQVTSVNDPPVITAQNTLTTLEDQPITLTLADFVVTDVDNSFPTGFTLLLQGNGANYTVSGTTVTPASNFNGSLGVGLVVNDGVGNSNVINAEILVVNVNDAPTLDAINNVTIQEDPLDVVTVGLTGISTGPGEGDQTVVITASNDQPDRFEPFEIVYTSGTTGSLRFKPKANVFGTVQVTIRIQDNGADTPAPNKNFIEQSFSLIIEGVNDAPVITSQAVTLAEVGQPYSYLVIATDVENEAITFAAPTIPAWLSLTQNANGSATLSGTPPAGTTGEIPVKIQAKDPSASPVTDQEFILKVNSRPTLTPFVIQMDEDGSYVFGTQFSDNFTDLDANPLAEIQIKQLPSKGTLMLNGSAVALNAIIPASAIPTLTYKPLPDSTGADIIQWNASDALYYSQTEANITVIILPVNDPPEIIAIEPPESDTLKYELGSEIPVKLTKLFDAKDVDGDNLIAAEIGFTESLQYRELQDKFIFNDTLGIVGNFNESFGILTLTGKAPVKDYVAAIRSIRYNYVAIDDFTLANRKVSIKLSDGAFGETKERLVGLIYTYLEIDIANAFTPNGDNPYWNIYSPNGLDRYRDALIRVYNKRGTLVYEAKGFDNRWNGNGPDGSTLPPDSYYYTIDLKYDKKKYKGVVTILR